MQTERQKRRVKAIADFEGLISRGITGKKISRGELNVRMGFSDTRMHTIRTNPLKVTFEEVGKLSDILGIPEEEFHEVLRNVPRG